MRYKMCSRSQERNAQQWETRTPLPDGIPAPVAYAIKMLCSQLRLMQVMAARNGTDIYMSKLKVEFNYSTIVRKRSNKAFHYQCFAENLTKGFSSVGSSDLMLILINY